LKQSHITKVGRRLFSPRGWLVQFGP